MKKFYNKELKSAGFPLSLRSAGMTESGRSMVEMLGVLAVIGVLSVAGIAGYTVAMNKHRANELLNEASKRATIVAMQLASGREKGSTNEFSGHSNFAGGSFDDTQEITFNNFNQFRISIKNLVPEVCQQMKNMVGETTPVRRIVCSSSAEGNGYLFFNNDLSTTDIGQLCNSQTGLRCTTNQICTTSGEVPGSCVNKNDSWECLTNADCKDKPNTYCQLSMANSTTISEGQCMPLGNSTGDIYIEELGTLEASDDGMNWYSAKNWCEAKGKSLIDIRGTRLGCYNSAGIINVDSSLTYEIYCCAKETAPCWGDITKQSSIMQKLRNNFGGGAWTNTDQDDSGRALNIVFSGSYPGAITFHGDLRGETKALCE